MSDDDPVEAFVEGSVEPFEESDERYDGPKARDMEAELRERTGVDGEDVEVEVSSETASAFWAAVIYVNAGVLLVALGPVVYALRGFPLVSVALGAGGVVAFWRAYSVYQTFEADDDDAAGQSEAVERDDAAEATVAGGSDDDEN